MTWKLLYIFQYKDNVWGIKKDAFWSMHYSDTKDIPALDNVHWTSDILMNILLLSSSSTCLLGLCYCGYFRIFL